MGNLTQAYLTFFPNWSEKTSLWFIKEETKLHKGQGQERDQSLKQNKLFLSDWGAFSFQKTFTILISSKNHTFRIIFWKKNEPWIKEASVFLSFFFCLFVWLISFISFSSSFTFSVAKWKDLQRDKKRKCQAATKKCGHFLYKCWWTTLN